MCICVYIYICIHTYIHIVYIYRLGARNTLRMVLPSAMETITHTIMHTLRISGSHLPLPPGGFLPTRLGAKCYTPEIAKVQFHWKIPLKIHWAFPVQIHWESDNPLGHAAETPR